MVSHYSKTDGKMTSVRIRRWRAGDRPAPAIPKAIAMAFPIRAPTLAIIRAVVVGADGSHGRVTYYDIDNLDLKYAEKTAGNWVIHTIDSGGAVGKYSFLEIMNGGARLRVTYLVESAPKDRPKRRATIPCTPACATSSPIRKVHLLRPIGKRGRYRPATLSPAPCGGTCQNSEICVVVSSVQKCAASATTCPTPAPTSSAGQVCATPDGGTTAGYYVENVARDSFGISRKPWVCSRAWSRVGRISSSRTMITTPTKALIRRRRKSGVARGDVDGRCPRPGSIDLTKTPVLVTLDAGLVCSTSTFLDVGRFSSIGVNPAGSARHRLYRRDQAERQSALLAIPSTNNFADFKDADLIARLHGGGRLDQHAKHTDKFITTIADDGINPPAVEFGRGRCVDDLRRLRQSSNRLSRFRPNLSLKLTTESAGEQRKFHAQR